MAPTSSAAPSDSRLKWKQRKRNKTAKKKPHEEEEDDDDDDEAADDEDMLPHAAQTSSATTVVSVHFPSKMDREESDVTTTSSMKSASDEISHQFRTLVDAQQVESLHQLQHLILGRLQDSNAVLSHFNEYSERCYGEVAADFVKNTRLLKSMKSDLDYIFLKLRSMKGKLSATYPDAFPDVSTAKMMDQRPDLEKPAEYHSD